MTTTKGTNAQPHDCKDHLVIYRHDDDSGYAKCSLCGAYCYIPPTKRYERYDIPSWFYHLCFGLGILSAILFLIVIVHEIWRMNQ